MKKILIVDDDSSIRSFLSDLLILEGWNVHTAENGENALRCYVAALWAHDPFVLVVTDFSMPAMNGIELTRELHKISESLPVVLLSGRKEENIARDLSVSQAHAYIVTKPLRCTGSFLEMLKTLVRDEDP